MGRQNQVLSQIVGMVDLVLGLVDWTILRGSRTAVLDATFLSSALGPYGSYA